MSKTAIELSGVSLKYRSEQKETLALDNFSLEVAAGEPIAIIGASGCGKTSVLNLIAGLLKPTSGTVKVMGEALSGPRSRTSLILQDYGLLPWKTVLDNAALGLIIQKMPVREARARATDALRTVGIEEFARSYPRELSGGMSQRLAMARAMALDSDIMLMDEPLSALDALTREELQKTLIDLWQHHSYTQVLVTHSIEEAALLGRRIVLMTPRPGRIRQVIENPGMGDLDYRHTTEFHDMCRMLRELLMNKGEGSTTVEEVVL
ncbi:MAG: ABC transporter ATP-binding protein [Coriobacteriia bacterium]|nr:ABC transporter ATP-binding protein [Coriobacteriia bacterium]MCL2537256.1 ABC transporter ATP-binding protein [Coriobacteriia bacterium]